MRRQPAISLQGICRPVCRCTRTASPTCELSGLRLPEKSATARLLGDVSSGSGQKLSLFIQPRQTYGSFYSDLVYPLLYFATFFDEADRPPTSARSDVELVQSVRRDKTMRLDDATILLSTIHVLSVTNSVNFSDQVSPRPLCRRGGSLRHVLDRSWQLPLTCAC